MQQIIHIIAEITDNKTTIEETDVKIFLENILSLEFIKYKPYYKELENPG